MFFGMIFFAFIAPGFLIILTIVLAIIDWNKGSSSHGGFTSGGCCGGDSGSYIEPWYKYPPIMGNDYTNNYINSLEPKDYDDHFIEKDIYRHVSDRLWK